MEAILIDVQNIWFYVEMTIIWNNIYCYYTKLISTETFTWYVWGSYLDHECIA